MSRDRYRSLILSAAAVAAAACGGSSSPTPSDESPAGASGDAGVVPGLDGAIVTSDGTIISSDGAIIGTDGTVVGSDGAIIGTDGKRIVDPTGVWWTEIETTGEQNLPTVGLLEGSKIKFVMRVVIAGSVPNQTATFEFCKLETEWASDALPEDVHIIGFRPEAAAAFGETLSVDFSGLSVGSHIPVPDLTFIAGGDATGAIIDEDGDGYPAITTYVRIILPFEVAEVITINAKLDVDATDENTLEGTLDFDVFADILDSSSAVFVPADFDVTILPDSNAVPVTVRRIPGGGGCDAIPSTLEFHEITPPGSPPTDPVFGPQSGMTP